MVFQWYCSPVRNDPVSLCRGFMTVFLFLIVVQHFVGYAVIVVLLFV